MTPLEIRLLSLPAEATPAFDLRHPYLEVVYAPLLGPTAVLLARYVARLLATYDGEAAVTTDTLAREIGVRAGAATEVGKRSPLHNAIHRLGHMKIVEWQSGTTLGVRQGVPPLGDRAVHRLPSAARRAHHAFVAILDSEKPN